MEGLSLRKASPRDSEFAYCTKRAAFEEYVDMVWGWDEVQQRQIHARRFSAEDVQVIAVRGRDVGYMATAVEPGCLKLNQLFIVPECQGEGIGTACLSAVIEEARALGLPVRLRVIEVNVRALALYRRAGFAVVGETDTHLVMERRP